MSSNTPTLRSAHVLNALRSTLMRQWQDLLESGSKKRVKRLMDPYEIAALALSRQTTRPTVAQLTNVVSPAMLGEMWERTLVRLTARTGASSVHHGCEKCDLVASDGGRTIHLEAKARRRSERRSGFHVSGLRPRSFTHVAMLLADVNTPAKEWKVLFLNRAQYKRLALATPQGEQEQISLSEKRLSVLEEKGLLMTLDQFGGTLSAM